MRISLVFMIFVLSGCGNIQTKEIVSEDVLVPLSVGSYWKYKELETGKVSEAKVVKSQSLNGKIWYRYFEFGNYFWVRNYGRTQIEPFYSTEKNLDLEGGEVVILDASSGKPKKYTVHGEAVLYSPCEKPITVEAGTFECHRFEFIFENGDKSINYYVLNVGLVKNEYIVNGVSTTSVLTEFSLN